MKTFRSTNQIKKISMGDVFPTDTILETEFEETTFDISTFFQVKDL